MIARISARAWFATLAIVLGMALVLLWMGRVPICECGTVELWYGDVSGPGNSQHIADWYSPSHFIHGLLFYWFLWLVARRTPLGFRLIVATLVEAAWEIIENTDAVIQRYREATIALDYYGDSVLNSVSDAAFMVVGFLFAARLPVWVSVAIAVFFELFVGWMIRDNLTLNVLMLLWPLDSVRAWQAGA